jgi:NTP pyrophosphatase (non-canonical NTP hydrolase)
MKSYQEMVGKVCVEGYTHVLPCGPTEYDDTCACGCDASGIRCGDASNLVTTSHSIAKEHGFWDFLTDYVLFRRAEFERWQGESNAWLRDIQAIIDTTVVEGPKEYLMFPPSLPNAHEFPAKIAVALKLVLIHSEVSEALEAVRKLGVWEEVVEELADIDIRVADLAGWLESKFGVSLEEEIERKTEKNRNRPKMHGGKAF